MKLFEYKSVNSEGKKIKQITSAQSLQEIKAYFFKNNIYLLDLKEIKSKFKPLKPKEVSNFTKELSKLLYAGISLYESLSILCDKYEKKNTKLVLLAIKAKISMGYSFSESLAFYKKSFNNVYISMIAASEKTGRLKEALEEIYYILEKQIAFKKKLVASFTYPIILACFCFLVLSALLFYIIPSLFDLFADRQLHPFTIFVLNLSKFACKIKPYLFFLGVLFSHLLMIGLYLKKVKKKLYSYVLKMPFLKKFMIKIAMSRFCRSFSTLLQGQVSFVNSFTLASKVMNHPVLEKDFNIYKNDIIEGKNLSNILKQNSNIPVLIPRMLSIAEESGSMSDMLNNIAKIYEDDIEKKLIFITSIMQPIILVFLGIIIGFVILSVLLPLTDVSSFIGS